MLDTQRLPSGRKNNHLRGKSWGPQQAQGRPTGVALTVAGSTHSQLLLDHSSCSCYGIGRVMLDHLGKLRQVPLHELQSFSGLWGQRRMTKLADTSCHVSGLLQPQISMWKCQVTESQGLGIMLPCPNSTAWITWQQRGKPLLFSRGLSSHRGTHKPRPWSEPHLVIVRLSKDLKSRVAEWKNTYVFSKQTENLL